MEKATPIFSIKTKNAIQEQLDLNQFAVMDWKEMNPGTGAANRVG